MKLFNSISSRLLAFFLILSLVPVIGVGISNYYVAKNQLAETTYMGLNQIVRNISADVDEWALTNLNMVKRNASSLEYMSNDKEVIGEILTQLQGQLNNSEVIVFTDPDGKIVSGFSDEQFDFKSQNFFKKAVSGESAISNLLLSPSTGKRLVYIAVPVKGQNNDIAGVLIQGFDFSEVTKVIKGVKYGETGYAYLTDNTGLLMVHPNDSKVAKVNLTNTESESLNSASKKMVQGIEGQDQYIYEGIDKLVSYTPVRTTGWVVAITAPTSEVFAGTKIMKFDILTGVAIAAVVVAFLAFIISRQISRPIVALAKQADILAAGNLAVDIDVKHYGELGMLGRSLQSMVENIRSVIGALKQGIANLDKATSEISESAEGMAQVSEQIAATITQMSASVQETASTVGSVNQAQTESADQFDAQTKNVDSISSTTKETVIQTRLGVEIMGDLATRIQETNDKSRVVQEAMNRLSEQAKEISGITNVIAGVAEQTNLLALNAAIEAARAGEAGKGFAVVAEEVRKLAEASSDQANEIARLIGQVTADVDAAVEATGEVNNLVSDQAKISAKAHEQFNKIAEGTENVSALLSEIQKQSHLIVEQVGKVSEGMENIAAISEENSASAEEIAASTEEMSSAAQTVSDSTVQLKSLMNKLAEESELFRL